MSKPELFFSPKGAIGRAQYWGASIVLGLCIVLLSAIVESSNGASILGVLFIPAIWSSFAITSKRLHDRGKSAWYWLLFFICAFIPGVNIGTGIWAFVELGCIKGKQSASTTGARKTSTPTRILPASTVVPTTPSQVSNPGPRRRAKSPSERRSPSGSPLAKKAPRRAAGDVSAKQRKPSDAGVDTRGLPPGRAVHDTEIVIQDMVDGADPIISLIPNEYTGPIVIRRDCEIDGRNSAIVAQTAPAVRIERGTVILRNLYIEVLDHPNTSLALDVLPKASVKCDGVIIHGCVSGWKGESGTWDIPKSVRAHYPTGKPPAFSLSIHVPVPCELESRLVDLDISPRQLAAPGNYDISCMPRNVGNSVHFSGDILIRTPQLIRRIPFTLSLQQPSENASPADANSEDTLTDNESGASVSTRRVVRQDMTNFAGWT